MDAISCPILSIRQATPKAFVSFWERLYSPYDEDFYRDNIGQELTQKRIEAWLKWKNGTPLSPGKAKAIRRYFSPKERLDHDADSASLAAFLNKPGGAIWRIFWLHLQHPAHFPIYDQHVHRTMAFMLNWSEEEREIPVYNPTKVRNYLEFYRPFFKRFADCVHRQVDRALWSFGQFLKLKFGQIITSPAK